jgi:hypothetical protein
LQNLGEREKKEGNFGSFKIWGTKRAFLNLLNLSPDGSQKFNHKDLMIIKGEKKD